MVGSACTRVRHEDIRIQSNGIQKRVSLSRAKQTHPTRVCCLATPYIGRISVQEVKLNEIALSTVESIALVMALQRASYTSQLTMSGS